MSEKIELPTVYVNYEVEKKHRDQLQTEEAIRDHDWIIEYLSNDHSHIDWVCWFRLPFWQPREAAYLLNLRDPKGEHENMSDYHSAEIEKFVELAERQIHAGILKELISPEEWTQWACNYQVTLTTPFTEFLKRIETSISKQTPDIDHNDKEENKINEQNVKPWLTVHTDDPKPVQPWYTPARYFARKLVEKDATLRTKRNLLAIKVASLLKDARFFKRGGKLPLDPTTVRKALSNVNLSIKNPSIRPST